MRVRTLGIAAVLMLLASPALAFSCPADMAKIDKALAGAASLSEADRAQVAELRSKGEALHQSGQHGQSVKALDEAKKILGID